MRLAMNYKFLEKNIVYFEGIIQNHKELEKAFESTENLAVTEWRPWYSYDKVIQYGDIKYLSKKELKFINDVEEKNRSKFIIETIINNMILCIKEYGNIFNISNNKINYASEILLNDNTTIGIYKYFENANMGPHVDWNDKSNYLEYTIVVYLNDDYEGGELYFNDFDIKLKPKAGSIVMYPSVLPYTHQSLKVLKGRKCLITHHWRNNESK